MTFSDLTAGDRSSYMKMYISFPPKGLQRQSYLHARDSILRPKRSWASFLQWTPFEWEVAPEDLWWSLPASLLCESLNHLMLTWWFMHMTFVNCVNHVISEGVKGVIGDAKGWEEKPKTQIALSKLLVPELNWCHWELGEGAAVVSLNRYHMFPRAVFPEGGNHNITQVPCGLIFLLCPKVEGKWRQKSQKDFYFLHYSTVPRLLCQIGWYASAI